MTEGRAYLALVVAVVGVSFASIFIRWSESTALVKATYRMGFATLLLLPLVLTRARQDLLTLSRRQWGILVAVGIVLAAHFATWIASLDFTSVASSVVLVNAHPLLVAILAHYLLRELLSRGSAAGILLGFSGVLVIAWADLGEPTGLLGDLLAFIGGSMTALYLLSGRRLRQRVSLLPYVFVVYGTSAVVLLGTTLILEGGLQPQGDLGRELLLFLGLAGVSTLLGHTLYNWSLRYVPTPVVSTSLLGEPVGASLLGLLLLGEVPSVLVVAGAALALLGIYLTVRTPPRAPTRTVTTPGRG